MSAARGGEGAKGEDGARAAGETRERPGARRKGYEPARWIFETPSCKFSSDSSVLRGLRIARNFIRTVKVLESLKTVEIVIASETPRIVSQTRFERLLLDKFLKYYEEDAII